MKILCDTQYDEVWWTHRQGVPTASRFADIITPAKGELSKSADGYACELLGDLADPNYLRRVTGDSNATSAMKNGTIMEPKVRRWYEFETGATVEQTGFIVDDSGRFGCSPDGLVKSGNIGLELKSPNPKTHLMYLLKGVLPDEYKPQVHGQLIICGFQSVDFASYVEGMRGFLIRVFPDEYTEKVRAAMEAFAVRMREIAEKVGIEVEQ